MHQYQPLKLVLRLQNYYTLLCPTWLAIRSVNQVLLMPIEVYNVRDVGSNFWLAGRELNELCCIELMLTYPQISHL